MEAHLEPVVETGLTERRIVEPATGQVFDLDAATGDLAFALDQAREMEKALYAFRKKVGEEVLARMDRAGNWTQRHGGYVLKGASPAPEKVWDGNDLALALGDLVMQGKLDKEAVEAAVEQEVRWKPKQRGINALLKIPGVGEYIEHALKEVERERRPPSVSRAK